MTTTKDLALEKLWNSFMKRYCPQPQGQNCCGNGYSNLYIAMGKKSPRWAWDITLRPSFQGHWVPSQDLLHLRKHKNASKNARKAKVKFYLTALILLSALLVLPFQWCWHFFSNFLFQYYYSVKDISVGGMCICYGHARACPLDPATNVCIFIGRLGKMKCCTVKCFKRGFTERNCCEWVSGPHLNAFTGSLARVKWSWQLRW